MRLLRYFAFLVIIVALYCVVDIAIFSHLCPFDHIQIKCMSYKFDFMYQISQIEQNIGTTEPVISEGLNNQQKQEILPPCNPFHEPYTSSHADPQDKTWERIMKIQKSFPNQTRHTWLSFYSALANLILKEPTRPEVLLLVGQNEEDHTMQEVAKQLAETINEFFPPMNLAAGFSPNVTVEVKKEMKEEAAKEELDIQIHSVLNQSYSVVIGLLENIPPKAALLLHGYCDNVKPQFKKRVIIFTAIFGFDCRVDKKNLMNKVDQNLHEIWDPILGRDNSASIVSRVSNVIVSIWPETKNSV